MCIHMYIFTYTYLSLYIYMYTYTYMCIHTHVYIYTHKHMCCLELPGHLSTCGFAGSAFWSSNNDIVIEYYNDYNTIYYYTSIY